MKVVNSNDEVTIYDDEGQIVGTCEAYELDYICRLLGVEYVEVEE